MGRQLATIIFFAALYLAPIVITEIIEPVPYYPPVMWYDDAEWRWTQVVC